MTDVTEEPGLDAAGLKAAKKAHEAACASPRLIECTKCAGKGYHHGFGEHGHDPDWCTDCGGGGFDLADGEEDRPLIAAISAYEAHRSGAGEREGWEVENVNGKRWRITGPGGQWSMQPQGLITADEAKAICFAALASPAKARELEAALVEIERLKNLLARQVTDKMVIAAGDVLLGHVNAPEQAIYHAARLALEAALQQAPAGEATTDETRCRWPECQCYGPQAPNVCRRTAPLPAQPEGGNKP